MLCHVFKISVLYLEKSGIMPCCIWVISGVSYLINMLYHVVLTYYYGSITMLDVHVF